MHAVEAHAEQMLDLLRSTPSVPAGRLVYTRDRRQARDGYDVDVRIDGAGLSQLAIGELAVGDYGAPAASVRRACKGEPCAGAPLINIGRKDSPLMRNGRLLDANWTIGLEHNEEW